jgi:uncharacterized lipoprotein YddW (UPF0748 family)
MEEIRGVWLTNADSDILQSRENIRKGFAQLKALEFNTIYQVVWQRGYTLYFSQSRCLTDPLSHDIFV